MGAVLARMYRLPCLAGRQDFEQPRCRRHLSGVFTEEHWEYVGTLNVEKSDPKGPGWSRLKADLAPRRVEQKSQAALASTYVMRSRGFSKNKRSHDANTE